jgi:hypothetical protein
VDNTTNTVANKGVSFFLFLEMSTLGLKEQPVYKADNFTTICELIV